MTRLASVSFDLDGVRCYHEIHGLASPTSGDPVLERGLPRALELCDRLGIRATLFIVARDLEDPAVRDRILEAARAGHEIASHSLDHRYDLVRLDRAALEAQIVAAARAIAEWVGRPPEGFRAPGYTVSDDLLEVLAATGALYDSSVFPCPAYWAAKAAAMASIRIAGRRSRSILGTPSVLFAPADPYRVGRPYHRRGSGILELPIGVTSGARLPFIGTALVLAGERGARWLARAMRRRPFVNLELHAIDLCDDGDGLERIARSQPDLRVPLALKQKAIRAAVETIREGGATFVPLAEAARYWNTC